MTNEQTTEAIAHADEIKVKQATDRKAANEASAVKAAPKTAGSGKAVKVVPAKATPKAKVAAPKVKAPKVVRATKAQAVRDLLDKGQTVREIAKALAPTWAVKEQAAWSYVWDVAAAYEKALGAPGKFIASRAPGYVKVTAPKVAKAPKATPAKKVADEKVACGCGSGRVFVQDRERNEKHVHTAKHIAWVTSSTDATPTE